MQRSSLVAVHTLCIVACVHVCMHSSVFIYVCVCIAAECMCVWSFDVYRECCNCTMRNCVIFIWPPSRMEENTMPVASQEDATFHSVHKDHR